MKPETIRKYLRALDDDGRAVVRSEVARWDAAKRTTNAGGRPVVLAPCPKGCGAMLTARERHTGHVCPTA